jgi:hypothetical protein
LFFWQVEQTCLRLQVLQLQPLSSAFQLLQMAALLGEFGKLSELRLGDLDNLGGGNLFGESSELCGS